MLILDMGGMIHHRKKSDSLLIQYYKVVLFLHLYPIVMWM